MKVQIYLQLDSDWNTLDLPEMEVKDENDIIAIAKKAWTREQIEHGSVCYDIIQEPRIFCKPVIIEYDDN